MMLLEAPTVTSSNLEAPTATSAASQLTADFFDCKEQTSSSRLMLEGESNIRTQGCCLGLRGRSAWLKEGKRIFFFLISF